MTVTVRQHVTDEHGVTWCATSARAWRRAQSGLIVPGGNGDFQADGVLSNFTVTGTPSAGTEFGANKQGLRTRITSGATANDFASLWSQYQITSRNVEPEIFVAFSLEATTSIRFFAGLGSDKTGFGTDTPTGECVGLQFSTNRADTNFRWIEQNGTPTFTNTDSGYAPAAATIYVLQICNVANNADWRVALWTNTGDSWTRRDTRVLNTSAPGTGTGLYLGISCQTLTGASRYEDLVRLQYDGMVANNLE